MISSPQTPYPTNAVASRLSTETAALHEVDATELSAALTGSAAQANVLLLGATLQTGTLPITVESLERAIELNAVAVEANRAALYWGRRAVAEPDEVQAHAGSDPSPRPQPHRSIVSRIETITAQFTEATGRTLADLLSLLSGDLEDYQDRAFANRFLDHLGPVARAEADVDRSSAAVTAEAARGLYRFMALKDEYEVARLMLDPLVHSQAEALGGSGAAITWRLHPPMLKALGLDSKVSIGAWAAPAVKALARGKRLRGTRADVFGRSEHRQLERSLLPEYVEVLELVASRLTDQNHAAALELVALADHVRGYEELKTRRIREYRADLQRARKEFM